MASNNSNRCSNAAAPSQRTRVVLDKRMLSIRRSERVTIMPKDSHQRAAEFHEQAAHAHRAAAAHHGKEDHLTGHEHSKQAMEHSAKAFQQSQEALQKSAMFVKEKKT